MEFRMIRSGIVSSINYKEVSARIKFQDAPGVSRELKILQPHTNLEKEYSMPSIGEEVVCIFLPNSPSTGYIVGSFYSGKNLPGEIGNTKYIFFPDGTKLKYNYATHVLEVDCIGDINISSGSNISIKGTEVNIEADSFNVSASESNFDHNINCADVITDKGSHNNHQHKDAENRITTPPL